MVSGNGFKREFLYVVVIIILAAAIGYMFLQNTLVIGSQQSVTEKVTEVYKLLTENELEVLNVEDEGNLYKILLRLKIPSGDVLREVYATKDGKFFSEAGSVFETEGFMDRLTKEKNFVECLKTKGVLVFGQSNEPNTVQQLLIIGNFANKIFVDCVGANLEACQQLGIERIPTIVYEQQQYQGVKTRDWIEGLTGCVYG